MASSNQEKGHGSYDITIALEDIQRLFIFEFKVSDTMKISNDDAKVTLKQIHQMKYYEDEYNHQWKCIAIGILFHRNAMSQIECEEFNV
jgi:hypothetical protein